MNDQERDKKLKEAKIKYGDGQERLWVTEIPVKKKNIKPSILGKAKFQFQR